MPLLCCQAWYCRRNSPYPRFLSELLLWYMLSLLALFGAALARGMRAAVPLTLLPRAGHFYVSKHMMGSSKKPVRAAGGRKKAA